MIMPSLRTSFSVLENSAHGHSGSGFGYRSLGGVLGKRGCAEMGQWKRREENFFSSCLFV